MVVEPEARTSCSTYHSAGDALADRKSPLAVHSSESNVNPWNVTLEGFTQFCEAMPCAVVPETYSKTYKSR